MADAVVQAAQSQFRLQGQFDAFRRTAVELLTTEVLLHALPPGV
jgi:hypothetical protein